MVWVDFETSLRRKTALAKDKFEFALCVAPDSDDLTKKLSLFSEFLPLKTMLRAAITFSERQLRFSTQEFPQRATPN
jgi:hypothetical protein